MIRYAETPETAIRQKNVPHKKITVTPSRDAIPEAQKKVRELIAEGIPAGGILVELRGGEYTLEDTVFFGPEDSGTENAPIIWRSAPGETVLISGGKRLPEDVFSPVTDDDPLFSHFPHPEKVVSVSLSRIGTETPDFGCGYGEGYCGRDNILRMHKENAAWHELYLGENPLHEARYPRDGWLCSSGEELRAKLCTEIFTDDEGIGKIRDFTDVHYCGYPFYDWAFAATPVSGYDGEKKALMLREPVCYGTRPGQHFYLTRVPEALSESGDYLISSVTNRLYCILPENPDKLPLRLTNLTGCMLHFENASRISFEEISFGFCRGSAVGVYGGDHVSFIGCRFSALGFNAVRFGAQINEKLHAVDRVCNGGYDHRVVSCDISGAGFGGIYISAGNRETLRPCNIVVENCDIENFSRIGRCYCFGVAITAVGAVIRNNRFHNGAHAAIWFDGNDHLIEYNEFFDLLKEADDAACVYTGRNYTNCGTAVRWNFFHDMASHAQTRVSVFGTYDDDNSAGIVFYGNFYYHMQGCHHSHGGHDIVVENNLIVDGTENSIYSMTLSQLYGYDCLKDHGMHDALYEMSPADTPLWRSRYPHLREYLTWDSETEGRFPHYCSYRNNAIVRHKEIFVNFPWDTEKWQNTICNNPVIDEDPLFVNEAEGDLRLRPDSPVYKALPDFEPIPFEKIGIYHDIYRR